jgi:hypothetical protein
MDKTGIVCLCGSLRFKEDFARIELEWVLRKCIVLTPCLMYSDIGRTADMQHYKNIVDEIHKRKIDLADIVYIINKNGYIGESTRNEIEYAKSQNKMVVYMEVTV